MCEYLIMHGSQHVTRDDPAKRRWWAGPLTPTRKRKADGAVRGGGGGAVGGGDVGAGFVLVGHAQLDARDLNRKQFALESVPRLSPLNGTLHLRLTCVIESHVEERGFLVRTCRCYYPWLFIIITGIPTIRRRTHHQQLKYIPQQIQHYSTSLCFFFFSFFFSPTFRRCSRRWPAWLRGTDAGSS